LLALRGSAPGEARREGLDVPLVPSPAPVWIVGPVTWDQVVQGADIAPVAGGAALYTARACDVFEESAHILCLAGDDADLSALEGRSVFRVPSDTLTLRHDFPDGERAQSLVRPAGRTLTPDDAPSGWPPPATLILGPLLPEDVDVVEFVDAYPGAEVALLAQGLQRAVLPDGRIAHRAQPSSALIDCARPNVSIFLSDEEVRLWAAGALEHLAARAGRVVVTHGRAGASIIDRHGRREVSAMPAQVVDATGAGDVFAAAFILALRAGEAFAGRLAAAYAAAAVEVRGAGALPSLAEIEARFGVSAAPPAEEGRSG
jgi:sugar/nucleoside kinase (ribokinase family)